MEIRAITAADLSNVVEIDAVVESTHYVHVDREGEQLSTKLRTELRSLREKLITANPLNDSIALAYRQVATGADEGIGLVAEHDGQLAAAVVAQPDYSRGVMQLLDLRVDYDFRRQGLATAIIFQIIQTAREAEFRALSAEIRTNNFPGNQLAIKTGFDLSGIDLRRQTNHDLVKEAATLIWYVALD